MHSWMKKEQYAFFSNVIRTNETDLRSTIPIRAANIVIIRIWTYSQLCSCIIRWFREGIHYWGRENIGRMQHKTEEFNYSSILVFTYYHLWSWACISSLTARNSFRGVEGDDDDISIIVLIFDSFFPPLSLSSISDRMSLTHSFTLQSFSSLLLLQLEYPIVRRMRMRVKEEKKQVKWE